MQIEYMIYIYGLVCASMLVFNGVFSVSRRASLHRAQERARRMEQELRPQLERIAQGLAPEQKHLDRMSRKLRRIKQLMYFHAAVVSLREQEPELTQRYLEQCRSLFLGLAVAYSSASDMKKAYFAFLMSEYRVEQGASHSALAHVMVEYAMSRSAYCCENALKALYGFGNASYVTAALMRLDEMGVHRSSKLLTDGLASFQGSHSELCRMLWENFTEMSEELRLVFLNYARLVTADYCEPFAALLEDPRQGMECRLAVLRYFRKYHYPPVWEKILSYVENYRENNWEYASVAALTLQNYPGQQSVQALKKALSSPNWYVRYNAAESLRVLGADYLDLMDVLNGNDRYAREMLEFQLDGLKRRRDPA